MAYRIIALYGVSYHSTARTLPTAGARRSHFEVRARAPHCGFVRQRQRLRVHGHGDNPMLLPTTSRVYIPAVPRPMPSVGVMPGSVGVMRGSVGVMSAYATTKRSDNRKVYAHFFMHPSIHPSIIADECVCL